jgi:hypothetical protein
LKRHNIPIRGKQSKLSEDQTIEMLKRYLKGDSILDISNDFNIHSNTLYRILNKNGITSDRKRSN